MSPARLSGLQCFNMGHNGHGINIYDVVMIFMGNLHAGGQNHQGHLSLQVQYVALRKQQKRPGSRFFNELW